jgi:hypothetical protein
LCGDGFAYHPKYSIFIPHKPSVMNKILLFIILFLVIRFNTKAQVTIVNDTIPVIVHIIHANEPYGTGMNIDSVQVYSQFKVLNDDFNGVGFNIQNVPAVWQPLIAVTGIKFVPALYDPQGNLLAEPGIDRVPYTSINGLGSPGSGYSTATINSTIKPATGWPPSSYLNIWVLKLGGGLMAYSTLPNNSGLPWLPANPGVVFSDSLSDGVVTNYQAFGDTLNVIAPYDKGRATTHEMGHWLGLVHMVSGCNPQYCSDIPTGNYFNVACYGCPNLPCAGSVCSNPDGAMLNNFMSYTDDACMNMFTQQQGDTMKYVLHHAPWKDQLQYSSVYKLNLGMQANSISEKLISLSPNPSNGSFYISKSAVKASLVSVTDIQGKNIQYELAENLLKIFGTKGIYFVKFSGENGVITKKVVVE